MVIDSTTFMLKVYDFLKKAYLVAYSLKLRKTGQGLAVLEQIGTFGIAG
jgi:hypothetical protein